MPTLAVGLGTAERACSIAALNLALTGTLTDTVPDCMSHVIGRWIIGVQDLMPATIRDSADWREMLVLAAGTGREHETDRLAMVMDWMWGALALLQPRADKYGYGERWAAMLRERTCDSAQAAAEAQAEAPYAAEAAAATAAAAAYAASATAAYVAEGAARDAAAAADAATAAASDAAAYAAAAADAAAYEAVYAAAYEAVYAAAYAARAATLTADATAYAASAAYAAADAAAYAAADADAYAASAAYAAADATVWATIDPVGLLRQLVAVTDARAKEDDGQFYNPSKA
jgi:hypothetical protein